MRRVVIAVLVVTALGFVLSGTAVAGETVDDSDDVGTDQANLQLASVDAPDEIEITESLTVSYTIENVGDEAGQESFVDLVVDDAIVDTDEDVAVPAGETTSGTLTYDEVAAGFDPGETISFSVELWDFVDAVGGQTDIAETDDPPETPEFVVASIDAPETVGPDESLTVGYTVENIGEATGTESFVDLVVDGIGIRDTDKNVTLAPGETASGTLTYDGVSQGFAVGETIGFEVSLWDFDDNESSETAVEFPGELQLVGIDYPETVGVDESLAVEYTIENVGSETGTESVVGLLVGEDYDSAEEVDRAENVTVPPGGTASGTLTFDGVADQYAPGDTFGLGVGLIDFEDQMVGQTTVVDGATGGADLQLTGVAVPDEIPADESLEVTYTIENVGDSVGTEESVSLLVDGQQVDADENVTVQADDTETGTLVYENIEEAFEAGDTLPYTVALSTFGDSSGGEIVPESQDPADGATLELTAIDPPNEIAIDEDLEVPYTVENTGNETGTESAVTLVVGGQTVDTEENVTVDPGASSIGTLTYTAVDEQFDAGDTIELSVELSDFDDSLNGTTDIETTDNGSTGADLQLASVDAPDSIATDEILPVSYTIENVGNESGTESAVTLLVGDESVDTDENVTALAGESTSGTLVFTNVDEQFDGGDTVVFAVELADFADSTGGTTDIESDNSSDGGDGGDGGDDNGTTGADLQLTSLDAPENIGPDEDLQVTYTIENVGTEAGTESFVDFRVDGGVVNFAENVTVEAGESETGTFIYDSVSFEAGDVVEFSVELVDFEDSIGGQVTVGNLDQSGSITIDGTVRTDSVSVGVEIVSLDVIDDTGWLVVENLDNDNSGVTNTVEEGDFELVSVENIGGVAVGDTIEIRLAAESDFTDVLDTATTTVEAGDNEPIAAFGWAPGAPRAGQTVTFDAGNARGEGGEIVEYRWDFTGDGEFDTVSETAITEHTFETAGDREVRLVVENEVGLTAERTQTIAVQEPPAPAESSLSAIDVARQGPSGTVEPGANDVSVTVTNVGDQGGSFEVTLTIGSAVTETRTTDPLGAGGQQDVVFEGVTAGLDPGEYEVEVSTANDTITGGLTVESPPEPEPSFAVDIVGTNSPVTAGGNLTVTAEIENVGDGDGTATVDLDGGGLGSDTASVTLDSGEVANATLAVAIADGESGEYEVTATVGSDASSTTVTVDGGGGGGSLITPTLVFVLLLVVLLAGGGFYYYVYEQEDSSDTMDSL